MPGHVKLGKSGEPDPDPAPYLIISMEMKREDMLKPYDPKKSVWVPTDDHGFREGLLESDDGTKAVVMCGHEVNGVNEITCDTFLVDFRSLSPPCDIWRHCSIPSPPPCVT